METEQITVEKNGLCVKAAVVPIHNDFLIIVTGGDNPHIGAVSFGNKYEENDISLKGHEELVVTQKMFIKLKNICNGNILITGGIHIDNISREQIRQILVMCDLLTEKIALLINKNQ